MSDARFKSAIEEMNARRDQTGVDINGKKYAKVSDRVEVFRQQFGADFGIDTNVNITHAFTGEAAVIVKANIVDIKTGHFAGSGHAMAFYGSDEVNTTSIVEACETAAIGRALATFGLAGGEFASANEMEALPVKREAVKQSTARVVKQGSKEPAKSKQEAEFRKEVDKHFPPSVNQFNFYIPDNVDPESISKVFMEIDRIETPDELSAYWKALEETLQWVKPEDAAEIKASFKTRNNQMKGM